MVRLGVPKHHQLGAEDCDIIVVAVNQIIWDRRGGVGWERGERLVSSLLAHVPAEVVDAWTKRDKKKMTHLKGRHIYSRYGNYTVAYRVVLSKYVLSQADDSSTRKG